MRTNERYSNKIYNCDTNDDDDDDDINISHYRISREDHHPNLVLIEFGHYIAAYSLI